MKNSRSRSVESKTTRRLFWIAHPRWANLTLIVLTLFALSLCLWLFIDITASQHKFQSMLLQHSRDKAILEDLKSIYQQEIWLDWLLLLPILVLGLMLFGFVTFYFKTSQQLKEARSVENYILQSITRGVLTIDKQYRVTSCNRAMQEILGICRETCYQKSIDCLLPADDPIIKNALSIQYNRK